MWYTSGSDSCDYDDFFNAVDVSVLLRDRRTKRKAGKLILIEKSASFLCFQRFLFTNKGKLDTLYIKL